MINLVTDLICDKIVVFFRCSCCKKRLVTLVSAICLYVTIYCQTVTSFPGLDFCVE